MPHWCFSANLKKSLAKFPGIKYLGAVKKGLWKTYKEEIKLINAIWAKLKCNYSKYAMEQNLGQVVWMLKALTSTYRKKKEKKKSTVKAVSVVQQCFSKKQWWPSLAQEALRPLNPKWFFLHVSFLIANSHVSGSGRIKLGNICKALLHWVSPTYNYDFLFEVLLSQSIKW